jgi:glutathione S-transferase
MVPAHFVTLDTMPLTPNRKVDRKALPAPQARVATPAAFDAPVEGVEAQLAAIWQRVLGVPKVGAKDNFFALGGHSLLAVQAHREIRDRLGATRISITDIFRFPVLSALAAHIEGPKNLAPPAAAAAAAAAPARPAAAPEVQAGETLADAMERRRAMRMARRGVDA